MQCEQTFVQEAVSNLEDHIRDESGALLCLRSLPSAFSFGRGRITPIMMLMRARWSRFSLIWYERLLRMSVTATFVARGRSWIGRLSLLVFLWSAQWFLKSIFRGLLPVLRASFRVCSMARNGTAATQSRAAPVCPPCRCIRTGSGVSSPSWRGCGGCRYMRERR